MSTTSDDFIRFDFLTTDAYQYEDDDDSKIIYLRVRREIKKIRILKLCILARTVSQYFDLFCFQNQAPYNPIQNTAHYNNIIILV